LNHRAKKVGIGDEPLAYLLAQSQSQERIADQSRRRFVCLREEADSIRENGASVFAPDAFRLTRKIAQQAVIMIQQIAKHLKQMSCSRLAALDLFVAARRRDASREIVNPQSCLMERLPGGAEQTATT